MHTFKFYPLDISLWKWINSFFLLSSALLLGNSCFVRACLPLTPHTFPIHARKLLYLLRYTDGVHRGSLPDIRRCWEAIDKKEVKYPSSWASFIFEPSICSILSVFYLTQPVHSLDEELLASKWCKRHDKTWNTGTTINSVEFLWWLFYFCMF